MSKFTRLKNRYGGFDNVVLINADAEQRALAREIVPQWGMDSKIVIKFCLILPEQVAGQHQPQQWGSFITIDLEKIIQANSPDVFSGTQVSRFTPEAVLHHEMAHSFFWHKINRVPGGKLPIDFYALESFKNVSWYAKTSSVEAFAEALTYYKLTGDVRDKDFRNGLAAIGALGDHE